MSRHWMKMYWADYLADTMHLSQGQHGAYLLLIASYWNKGELLAKHCYSIARATNEQERSNVDEVLEQFFVRDGDRFVSRRVEQEIAEAKESYRRRAEAGSKGGAAKAGKNQHGNNEALQPNFSSNATAMPKQPEPEPVSESTTGVVDGATAKSPRFKPGATLIALGVSEQVARDWLQLRKQRRAAVTETAINGVVREAGKAGISVEDAMRICCEKGWAGFDASWNWQATAQTLGINGNGQRPLNRQEQLEANNRAVAAGWVPPEMRGEGSTL